MLGKLSKALTALWDILKNPWLLNLVYDRDDAWRNRFKKAYPDTPALLEYDLFFLNKPVHLEHWSFSGGGSMPTDIALLKALCSSFENCSYFEVGTWTGESAANLSQSCSKIYSLDLPESELRSLGASEEYIKKQGYLLKDIPHAKCIKANSLLFDFSSLNEAFDVVFIDGDHHYDAVFSDTQNALKHLVHSKSFIVWHDYAHQPGSLRWEVYKAILDAVPVEKHSNLISFKNTLCAVLCPPEFLDKIKLSSEKNPEEFTINFSRK